MALGPSSLALESAKVRALLTPTLTEELHRLHAPTSLALTAKQLAVLRDPIGKAQLEQVRAALSGGALGSVSAWAAKQQLADFDLAQRTTLMLRASDSLELSAQSAKTLAVLSSIGAALKQVHPYEGSFTEALRGELGDWRGAPEPSAAVYVDMEARVSYYAERGFDTELTDVPEATLARGMAAADLCEDYLEEEDLDFDVGGADEELEAAIKRANKCHQYLFRMEYRLRHFVHSRLAGQYGEDWPSRRLDSRLLTQWKEKEEKAREADRPFNLLVEAADFTDYERLIIQKEHWQLFAATFKDKRSVEETFRRLRPLRLDASHARVISKEDLLLAVAECVRVLRALPEQS